MSGSFLAEIVRSQGRLKHKIPDLKDIMGKEYRELEKENIPIKCPKCNCTLQRNYYNKFLHCNKCNLEFDKFGDEI